MLISLCLFSFTFSCKLSQSAKKISVILQLALWASCNQHLLAWKSFLLARKEFRRTFFIEKTALKPKFSIDTLNDNVKSFQWKHFILQFDVKKNFTRKYFLAVDREMFILLIKDIKSWNLSSVCFSFKSSAFRRSLFWRRFV